MALGRFLNGVVVMKNKLVSIAMRRSGKDPEKDENQLRAGRAQVMQHDEDSMRTRKGLHAGGTLDGHGPFSSKGLGCSLRYC